MAFPPALSNRYETLELIAEGGYGTVYKAVQRSLNRVVALKIIKPDMTAPEAIHRLKREAEVLGDLRHPNIITLYDCDIDPPYIAMEHVRGGKTLEAFVTREDDPRNAREFVRDTVKHAYLVQIADALRCVHTQGIIHRDLKPSNVLIAYLQGAPTAKVADFGLTKRFTSDQTALTKEGAILGTLRYMAPEQLEGRPATDKSDVFSFALLAFTLIEGKLPPPYGATPPRIGHKHPEIFHRCLRIDPAQRPTMAQVHEWLTLN